MAPFKKIRGVNLPYRKQGRIYFTLVNYDEQPKNVKNRIDRLIEKAAHGEVAYCAALRSWLLKENVSAVSTAVRFAVSESTLYRARKFIYENW